MNIFITRKHQETWKKPGSPKAWRKRSKRVLLAFPSWTANIFKASIPRMDTTVPKIEIRSAESEDLPEIAKILESLGYPQSDFEELEAAFQEVTSRKDMGVLVAAKAGLVLGLLTYSFKPQLRFGGLSSFEIDELGVAPEARGSGIGSLLLDQAREIAKSVLAKRMILSTNRQRESYQRAFYTKNGFVEVNSAFMKYEIPRS